MTKKQHVFTTPNIIALLSLLLMLSGLEALPTYAQSTPIPKDNEPAQRTDIKPVLPGTFTERADDHVLGAKTAPITMIVYASVMCPHCAHWFNSVWPDVKKSYVNTGKLRVVFREMPTPPANIAAIGFQIASCAPKDQYFDMIEYQFQEQENIITELKAGRGKEKYLNIAKKSGLETEDDMNKCISNQAGIEHINTSVKLAGAAGINSVPNFIINGEKYKGGSDFLALGKHINGLLSGGSTPLIFK